MAKIGAQDPSQHRLGTAHRAHDQRNGDERPYADHRGISHGRDTDDVGRGLRAVAWERSAGQVVQVVLTVAVLLVVPSPVQAAMPLVALALLAAAAGVALAAHAADRRPAARRRGARAARRLLARRAWPAIALASALVVAGHAATFLIAARAAGRPRRRRSMLPLALLVLLAAALPNVGGWGPREGVTAWAFAAAGLGASLGVATAVVYGVMVFVATLPGAAVSSAWCGRCLSARTRC